MRGWGEARFAQHTRSIHLHPKAPELHSLPLLAAAVGLGKEYNGGHREDDESHREGTNTGGADLHQKQQTHTQRWLEKFTPMALSSSPAPLLTCENLFAAATNAQLRARTSGCHRHTTGRQAPGPAL